LTRVRTIAVVSGAYDALVAVLLLFGRPLLQQLFQAPAPQPPIHADLNGIFCAAVAAGYWITYRDPESAGGRAYLWIMGPLLKGAGAAAFVLDHLLRGAPASFLLFAVSDGSLALLTLWALTTSASTSRPAAPLP
jgi:hypothetical protein